MVNVKKLRGKIVERGMNVESVAESMKIARSTLYRKLGAGGDSISIREAKQLAEILSLSPREAEEIFFAK